MIATRRQFFSMFSAAGLLKAAGARPRITRLRTRKHTIGNRDYLFLEVETDAGVTGLGEGSISGRVEIVEQAIQWYTPHLAGKDPGGIEDHWNRNYYQLSRYRNGPVLMTALAAVDIALWDIAGKLLNQPVWRLLGAGEPKPMPVYYSHWSQDLNPRTPAKLRELAAETRRQGWTTVKWVLPRGGTEAERLRRLAAEVEAVRQGGGPDFEIALEMWETFSTRGAIEFAKAVAPFRPLFIEEPTWREMPGALREVAAKSPVPLAGGEGLISRYEFKQLLDAGGAQIVQPDVIHCGGISEIRKIAALSDVYGTEIAPHMYYGPVAHVASLQAMSAVRNFLTQEWDAGMQTLFERLTRGTFPRPANGAVALSERPGLGLEMDWAAFDAGYPYKGQSLRPPGGRQ
ncbi:MAG: mandelate racemase/muconate lactonizing enzyme family protein [Acidobacteria bacterium]|nr:mandelate racemase/muconate lactonizing enzyme family protein [Acidobacteriota bacterium]